MAFFSILINSQLILLSEDIKTKTFNQPLLKIQVNIEEYLNLLIFNNLLFFIAISAAIKGYVLSTLTNVYSPCFVCEPKQQNNESNF